MQTARNNQIIFAALAAVLGLVVLFWYFITITAPPAQNSRPVIATTIFPLADIARNIAGDRTDVMQLLPPGASPHTYSLTPQQLAQLQRARVLFVIGRGLDDWAAGAATRAAGLPIVAVDDNITLNPFGAEHDHEHEDEDEENEAEHDDADSFDPHYWLSVPNAKHIAQTISNQLSSLDPSGAKYYAQRTLSYLEQLDDLERELQQQASQSGQKEFIAVHDAWSYFSAQYGFELAASYEPTEGRQPAIADIRRLQDIISEHNISTFYTEPQKRSATAIRFIQEDLGLNIEVIDPIGGEGRADSYINLMRYNMEALAN